MSFKHIACHTNRLIYSFAYGQGLLQVCITNTAAAYDLYLAARIATL
jgi:hypothetical protein